MGSVNNIQVLGANEVIASLKQVRDSVRKRISRKALYQGAVKIRDEARRLAPKRYGILSKAVIARTDKDPDNEGQYAGYVTIAKKSVTIVETKKGKKAVSTASATKRGLKGEKVNPRRYAHLVEYGTQPHAIGKGSELSTRAAMRGKVKKIGGMHPGARAKPFLRPALETKRGEALEAVRKTIVREIVQEAVKHNLKADRGASAA